MRYWKRSDPWFRTIRKIWKPIWKTLCWIVSQTNLDELPPEAIKNKLKKLEQEFDQLLVMAGEGNEIAERKLEQIGKEMRKLKEKR